MDISNSIIYIQHKNKNKTDSYSGNTEKFGSEIFKGSKKQKYH